MCLSTGRSITLKYYIYIISVVLSLRRKYEFMSQLISNLEAEESKRRLIEITNVSGFA